VAPRPGTGRVAFGGHSG
jgi:putative transposase